MPRSKLHSSLMGAEVEQGRECRQAGYKVNAALTACLAIQDGGRELIGDSISVLNAEGI